VENRGLGLSCVIYSNPCHAVAHNAG